MGLKQGSICLRAPEPDDVDFLFRLENDRKLWHVSNTQVPYSRFDLEQYLFSTAKAEPFVAKQVRFMIDLVQENKTILIGTIDLFEIDATHRRACVGIVILTDFREKLYASQALKLCADYAFNELNLHQLYCNIDEDNTASLALFRKHGFGVVGLKKDWNRRNGMWKNEYLLQKIQD